MAHATARNLPAEPVDARMIALMRCVLAMSALAVIWMAPTEPARFVELTYTSLAVYCLWSLALVAMERLDSGSPVWLRSHWIDIAWATYLIALTEGTNSIFFFLFLFAILVASFSRGFRGGMAATLASVVLFCLVGVASTDKTVDFELNRALIRPLYLLAIGGMMAFWGGREVSLRRRLLLLREIGRDWDPRLGMDRAIGLNLERVLHFFEARQCLLVTRSPSLPATWQTYVASEAGSRGAHLPRDIDEATARTLFALSPEAALGYVRSRPGPPICVTLSNILETDHFATVPYVQDDGTRGRLYLMPRKRASPSDVEFLVQVVGAIAHVAENARRAAQLVLNAAEQERFRISLDIHDTTVQPYIGLKLGLDALQREAGPANPLAPRIAELLELATMTIRDLRGYALGLREGVPASAATLLDSVREHTERMERFYGIEVALHLDPSVTFGPHAVPEVFRIVSEGLSNVLRHTSARRAFVQLSATGGGVRLSIGNEAHEPVADFVPRSIAERARALGGSAWVERGVASNTIVHVELPT